MPSAPLGSLFLALALGSVAQAKPLTHDAATAAWRSFVGGLATGRIADVKARSTKRGYAQLLVYLPSDQPIKDFFGAKAALFGRLEVHWSELSEERCRGELGAQMKASPIELKREDGQWKFDYWGGPGK